MDEEAKVRQSFIRLCEGLETAVTESELSHRMRIKGYAWVGRDPSGLPSLTLAPKVTLWAWVLSKCFLNPIRLYCDHFPVPVLKNPLGKKLLLVSNLIFPWLSFSPFLRVLSLVSTERTCPPFSPHEDVGDCNVVLAQSSLFQPEKNHVSSAAPHKVFPLEPSPSSRPSLDAL